MSFFAALGRLLPWGQYAPTPDDPRNCVSHGGLNLNNYGHPVGIFHVFDAAMGYHVIEHVTSVPHQSPTSARYVVVPGDSIGDMIGEILVRSKLS
jgi:hypothetical protein